MVEIKETPKIVIAKPAACRPSLSKPFSEFVSGAVNASSTPSAVCEAAVAIVRPRTLRFNPTVNVGSAGDVDCRLSEKAPETKMGSNVVYKPVAKVVSKRTLSLLANLGNGRGIILRQDIADAGTSFPPSNQDKPQTNPSANFHHDIPPESKTGNAALKNAKDDTKSLPLPHVGDQSSYDGHTWRKYGQKQVKGSEYPRSYYKCTHPHCPVKKKVEKTLDGQIAEIVYNGEHNHSKHHATLDENARVEDPVIFAAPCNASVSTSNNSVSGFEEASESLEVEGNKLKSKQMKNENQNVKGSAVGEASSKPRTEFDTVEDRFRWRKYGQKVVKGNPYPRSYYKCTSPKCNARKYVERTSEDPDSFITTYEGRHNHGIPPLKTMHSEASKKTCKDKS